MIAARSRVALATLVVVPPVLAGQHPYATGMSFDPAVPTPRSVLEYEVGDRFTPHHLLMRYLERLAAASPRVRVDTVGRTFEGREVVMAIVTSTANQERADRIRADAARLADPRSASSAELTRIAGRLPAIAWLGYTVHGDEASGVEAAIALLYQLAAGQDEETRLILDSVVVLIDPVQNPDGHERHAHDVERARGAVGVPTNRNAMIHGGTWPGPRTSHYHFDLNRDWFIQSHPESRGRTRAMLRWWPHVVVDLHEMGSDATYFFPPPMEPVNKLVHPTILKWWEVYAAANAAAFDRHGWSFFRREGYDEFYPGYGSSWPIYLGAAGMTYEQASSEGGAVRRDDGTVLTLRDAAHHHYATSWATLLTTARRARERVRDYLAFRQAALTDPGAMRAIVFERDADGRADSLAALLAANGITVGRLRAAVETRDATAFGEAAPRPVRLPAGAYVVDLAQPQGRLAKAILEPDAPLDSSFIAAELERRRTGQPDRFYDLTAWALPYTFRLRAWWTRSPVGPADSVRLGRSAADAGRGAYGYAFPPASEASLRLLARLLTDSVRVWYAPRAFRAGGATFPRGAFVVRAAANDADVHETIRREAAAAGARVVPLASSGVDEGTDLGSWSVLPIRAPRVALVGGPPVSGNSFGYAWYAFDQRLAYPVATVAAASVAARVLQDFDVLVVPSVSAGAFERTLGDGGRTAIAEWVRHGGTLVTLDGATAWLA
ncbi:MAG: M14 metallopeptidase family protein, partial [Gemmatimonadales bacterium]